MTTSSKKKKSPNTYSTIGQLVGFALYTFGGAGWFMLLKPVGYWQIAGVIAIMPTITYVFVLIVLGGISLLSNELDDVINS